MPRAVVGQLIKATVFPTGAFARAVGEGHDFPGLLDQGVPGVAAVIDDVVEGFENSVRQPVLPHELPNIFFGR